MRTPPDGAPGTVWVSQRRRRWWEESAGVHPRRTRNYLNRDFKAAALDTKWTANITYIRTAEHWLYRKLPVKETVSTENFRRFVGR